MTVDTPETHTATPSDSGRALQRVFDWVGSAVSALVAVAIIFALFFRVVTVDGTSMTHTLQPGDRLLLASQYGAPAYGDIVVITRADSAPLIKRVIGLAGDTIRIDEESGGVYRNGQLLEEPYIRDPFTPTNGMTGELTVPEGQIFVMGDNRGDSLDSRLLGCLSLDDVAGKVLFRLAPHTGTIGNGE